MPAAPRHRPSTTARTYTMRVPRKGAESDTSEGLPAIHRELLSHLMAMNRRHLHIARNGLSSRSNRARSKAVRRTGHRRARRDHHPPQGPPQHEAQARKGAPRSFGPSSRSRSSRRRLLGPVCCGGGPHWRGRPTRRDRRTHDPPNTHHPERSPSLSRGQTVCAMWRGRGPAAGQPARGTLRW